jgi:hypothetical protein
LCSRPGVDGPLYLAKTVEVGNAGLTKI